MGRSAAGSQRFSGMDGAEAEDGPAAMSVWLVGPAALSNYRVGDSGHPACRDRQAVPGVDARRGCGAATQAQSCPRRGCGPAKARGAICPPGAVGACDVACALRPLRCLMARQDRRAGPQPASILQPRMFRSGDSRCQANTASCRVAQSVQSAGTVVQCRGPVGIDIDFAVIAHRHT